MTAQVILSTYNGVHYLPALIESVLAQDDPNVTLLIRDDGSTDGTCAILAEAAADPRITVHYGENLGVIRSYLRLLEMAGADHIAFCDQDDVWMPDKVSTAVEMISGVDGPALYGSQVVRVDESLTPLGPPPTFPRNPSLGNALVENIAAGCTMLMNRAARDLIVSAPPDPAALVMHDWWAYLVVSAFGRVVYDQTPHIYYRQHAENVVGAEGGRWQARLRRFPNSRKLCTRQAEELERRFGGRLPPASRQTLERFLRGRASLPQRLGYALSGEAYRQRWLDDWIYRALVVIDHI